MGLGCVSGEEVTGVSVSVCVCVCARARAHVFIHTCSQAPSSLGSVCSECHVIAPLYVGGLPQLPPVHQTWAPSMPASPQDQ